MLLQAIQAVQFVSQKLVWARRLTMRAIKPAPIERVNPEAPDFANCPKHKSNTHANLLAAASCGRAALRCAVMVFCCKQFAIQAGV